MNRRTTLDLSFEAYGSSHHGSPLRWLPPRETCDLLLVAGIHGEEPDTTVILSRALRSLDPAQLSPGVGVILCANPDGLACGTRGNAHGVDLNRNFPTSNWQPGTVPCRWHFDEDEELPISTGASPGSEPETLALLQVIETVRPRQILTLHGPLACVDDPGQTPLGCWIAEKTGLPLVTEIGYATPGSLGSWAVENSVPLITWEFPPHGIETLSRSHCPVLEHILQGTSKQLQR